VDGLIGILQSCSIYASHVHYLNDRSEGKHAIEFARNLFSATTLDAAFGVTGEQLKGYGSFFFDSADKLWSEDAYVTSFCEDGDLLSQWRAYAMGGFAILFSPLYTDGDRRFHVRNREMWKTTIRKVIYSDDEKKSTLLGTLAAGIKANQKVAEDKRLENRLATLTSMQLQTWIHTVKHASFQSEREWRIISYVAPNAKPLRTSDGFLTRVAGGQLVPSIKLTPEQGKLLPVLGVKCGPNESRLLTEHAVRLLLSSHGYPADAVSTSTIPFRSRY
jgi:hypothetical protein